MNQYKNITVTIFGKYTYIVDINVTSMGLNSSIDSFKHLIERGRKHISVRSPSKKFLLWLKMSGVEIIYNNEDFIMGIK